MRRFLLLAVPVFALGSLFGIAQASQQKELARIPVCHKVSSKTNPYQRVIAVGSAQLKRYTAIAADIVPAPKTCPKSVLTAGAGGVGMTVNLLGVSEQPDLGDPDGKGTATIRLRQGQGQVCFTLSTSGIAASNGAHIHKGAVDAAGPVYVALTTPNAAGSSAGCAAAPRVVVKDILANPSLYYVNVHNTEFANGAVRGQLRRPPNIAILTAALLGANERPGPGDADGQGTGNFQINTDKNQLCYTLAASNIALPATGAHIHRGDATLAGPVIIPFTNPALSGFSSGCVAVDGALLREIISNPAGFYANVHSTEFGPGAVRATLQLLIA
jgi:hypothetical protein